MAKKSRAAAVSEPTVRVSSRGVGFDRLLAFREAFWLVIIAALLFERNLVSDNISTTRALNNEASLAGLPTGCTYNVSKRGNGPAGIVREISPFCLKNQYLNVHTVDSLLPADVAQRILEASVKNNRWSGMSAWQSGNHPTQDVDISTLTHLLSPDDVSFIEKAMVKLGVFVTDNFVIPEPAIDGKEMKNAQTKRPFYEDGYPYDQVVQLKGDTGTLSIL